MTTDKVSANAVTCEVTARKIDKNPEHILYFIGSLPVSRQFLSALPWRETVLDLDADERETLGDDVRRNAMMRSVLGHEGLPVTIG